MSNIQFDDEYIYECQMNSIGGGRNGQKRVQTCLGCDRLAENMRFFFQNFSHAIEISLNFISSKWLLFFFPPR